MIRSMRLPARFLFGAAMLVATADVHAAMQPPDLALTDLSGHIVPLVNSTQARASIFVFIRTDCPISDRYLPELERQQRQAVATGVEFALVFVDATESSGAIAAHLRSFNYAGRVIRDDRHTLVRLAGAKTTPEAAAFVHEHGVPRLVYRGRIDNRYVDFGRMRPSATDHDLVDVIDALEAGKRLTFRTTEAIGCVIADLR